MPPPPSSLIRAQADQCPGTVPRAVRALLGIPGRVTLRRQKAGEENGIGPLITPSLMSPMRYIPLDRSTSVECARKVWGKPTVPAPCRHI